MQARQALSYALMKPSDTEGKRPKVGDVWLALQTWSLRVVFDNRILPRDTWPLWMSARGCQMARFVKTFGMRFSSIWRGKKCSSWGSLSWLSPTCQHVLQLFLKAAEKSHPGYEWKHIGSIWERSSGTCPCLGPFFAVAQVALCRPYRLRAPKHPETIGLSHCPDAYGPELSGHQEVQDFLHRPACNRRKHGHARHPKIGSTASGRAKVIRKGAGIVYKWP